MPYKEARKRSTDEQQEHLREAKDKLNSEIKAFIASVIGFKRGYNGKGDAKMGIPTSHITEPLPQEVVSTLESMVNQFSNIVDGSKSMIDEQTQYSATRRKPVSPVAQQSPLQQAASQYEYTLVSYGKAAPDALQTSASWVGSRAWARLSLLRQISGLNRKTRLFMLGSAVDLLGQLKQLETSILDYKNPNSIPSAFKILSNVSSDFLSAFLRLYSKLEQIYNRIQKEKPGAASWMDAAPIQNPTPAAENPEQVPEKQIKPEKPADVSNPAWAKVEPIFEQIVQIESVVNYIAELEGVEKTRKSIIKSLHNEFGRDLVKLYKLKRKPASADIDTLSEQVADAYKNLLEMATSIMGPAKDFNELDKITLTKKASLSNWLHKKMLSINPNNLDLMRIEIAETVSKLKTDIDKLMNLLEDREQGIDGITSLVDKIREEWADLLNQTINLGQNFSISHKGEKIPMMLNKSDLVTLKDLKVKIITFKPSEESDE